MTSLQLVNKMFLSPPNSADFNPLDYKVWGAMLERYKTFHIKPKNIDELKISLQLMWNQLPQDSINTAILSFEAIWGFELVFYGFLDS